MIQESEFPDDENGQVLRGMAAAGVDLSKERPVEFMHAAPNESAAQSFAREVAGVGIEAEVFGPDEESLAEGHTDWDVCCVREMVPTHHNISATETQLATLARKHGCREDGWGFMD